MTAQALTVLDEGLEHYKNGHLELAEDALKRGLKMATNAWDYQIYLGMTYARLGKNIDAKREFMSIRDLCPNPELRKKAEAALYALNAKH